MSEMTMEKKEKLMADLRVVISDAEELLRMTAGDVSAGASDVRSRIQTRLSQAKADLLHLQEVVITKAKEVGHAADDFVHENPWKSIGIGAGIGLLVGLLIGRR